MVVSRQVALKPSRRETLIRVEERYAAAVRGALHGIPAAYGTIFGLAIGLEGIGGVVPGISLAAVLAGSGWALGRVLWNLVRGHSRRRVGALADRLAAEAELRAGGVDSPEEAAADHPPGPR